MNDIIAALIVSTNENDTLIKIYEGKIYSDENCKIYLFILVLKIYTITTNRTAKASFQEGTMNYVVVVDFVNVNPTFL